MHCCCTVDALFCFSFPFLLRCCWLHSHKSMGAVRERPIKQIKWHCLFPHADGCIWRQRCIKQSISFTFFLVGSTTFRARWEKRKKTSEKEKKKRCSRTSRKPSSDNPSVFDVKTSPILFSRNPSKDVKQVNMGGGCLTAKPEMALSDKESKGPPLIRSQGERSVP